MRRRDFISLIGGAAAWPFSVGAQGNAIRRLGVIMNYAETDPEAKRFLTAFTEKLAELGWIDGRNLRTDVRWAPGSVDRMRAFAKELVELHPDVILANSTPSLLNFSGRHEQSRLYLLLFLIRSAPVLLRAFHVQVETSPGSAMQNRLSRVSGWSC
jgi:putative ABC transport system substrate-binding protein